MRLIRGYGDENQILEISDEIVDLNKNIFPTTKSRLFSDFYGEPNETYWIVILDGNLPIAQTGISLSHSHNKSYWYMFNFGVRDTYRRQNWGERLFKLAMKFVKGSPLFWDVENSNTKGKAFYKKLGARIVNYDSDRDIIAMRMN